MADSVQPLLKPSRNRESAEMVRLRVFDRLQWSPHPHARILHFEDGAISYPIRPCSVTPSPTGNVAWPTGYPGLGSDTGPAKMLHSFTPGPFFSRPKTPPFLLHRTGNKKSSPVAWEQTPAARGRSWPEKKKTGEGGGDGTSLVERVAARLRPAARLLPAARIRPAAADRVKQQQGLSRDPYDRDGDARQVGGGGSDARQVRGGAVFSPSAFGGHLLAGDCILALLFSLFPARVLCLLPGIRCGIWFLISSWPGCRCCFACCIGFHVPKYLYFD
jgi:hypothetical protein